MSRCPVPIKVKAKDLSQIEELLRGGVQQVRVVVRALALNQLADGFTAPQVAQTLPLTAQAIRKIAHRYTCGGLDSAIYPIESSWPHRLNRKMFKIVQHGIRKHSHPDSPIG